MAWRPTPSFRDDLWHGRGEDPDDDYENIYRCALLLYFLRDPQHADLLWRAK